MTWFLRGVLRGLAAAALALLPATAGAFTGESNAQTTNDYPVELSCQFNTVFTPSVGQAYLVLFPSGSLSSIKVTGTDYLNGNARNTPSRVIATDLEHHCGLTNVTILSENGADSTFADDRYIGFTFRGTDRDNSTTYTYEIALVQDVSDPLPRFLAVRTAANTAPTADAGPNQTVASGASVTLAGSGTDADANTTLTYQWTQIGTPAVTLTNANTATPRFTAPTLPIGSANTVLTFRLTVSDGVESVTDDVQVTVTAPPNTPPTANAGTDVVVASNEWVYLDGRQSDSRNVGQPLTYAWVQTSGPSVVLGSGNTAQPAFVTPRLPPGPNVILTFELTVNDGFDSAKDSVQVTVTAPPNTPPVARAGQDRTVQEGDSVTLDGTGSNANDAGQSLTYSWEQVYGAPVVSLTGANTASPSFVAPTQTLFGSWIELIFRLTVSDGFASATDDVTITIPPRSNRPATADAGDDLRVEAGTTVILDGSRSSSNDAGQNLTYSWAQDTGSPSLALQDADKPSARFSAPVLAPGSADLTFSFRLEVNDGFGVKQDTVQITVTAPENIAPTADAGADQTVASGASVSLDGSGSSSNNALQGLTRAWRQTAGPDVTLAAANSATPSFTAPVIAPGADAVLTFELTVDDGFTQATDEVQITVTAPENIAPTADAGADQTVASGATATLDGSGSGSNNVGQDLTHAWRQTAGPDVTLAGANSATPSFTAPVIAPGADAVLTFELTVNDGFASATDSVQVTVTAPENIAPTANAGPDQRVEMGVVVTLDGSASSSNNALQDLTYSWRQTGGTSRSLSGVTSPNPSFTAPLLVPGVADLVLTFELTVNDGFASATESVQVTVLAPANVEPVADPGIPQTVPAGGGRVTLDGTDSQSGNPGQALSFLWEQTGGPGVTLSSATDPAPSFDPPVIPPGAPVVLTFRLTVNDGIASHSATVTITLTPPDNTLPTADAGPDRTVVSGAAVTLDGSASADPDTGQTLAFAWAQTAGPIVTMSGDTSDRPSFTAPVLEEAAEPVALTFRLTVRDGIAEQSDEVTVTVTPPVPLRPTVTLANAPATFRPGAPFRVDVAFSAPVTGFEAGDVTLANARVIALQGSGAAYVLQLVSDGTQDVTVSLPENAAVTPTGGGSLASNVVTVRYDIAWETQRSIGTHLQARGQQLIQAQPNLRRLLSFRDTPATLATKGGFDAQATPENGSFALTRLTDSPLWFTVQGSWASGEGTDSSYANLTLGGNLYRGERLILGVMAQLDRDSGTSGRLDIEGTGWLAGPFLVARAQGAPLSFSASYLVGQSDHDVTGLSTGSFRTDRSLLTAGVEGQIARGEVLFFPAFDYARSEERQKAFTDAAGLTIAAQTVVVEEASLGLSFQAPLTCTCASLLLQGGVDAVLAQTEAAGKTDQDNSARVTLGFAYDTGNGTRITATAWHDGIGADSFSGTGAQASYEFRF